MQGQEQCLPATAAVSTRLASLLQGRCPLKNTDQVRICTSNSPHPASTWQTDKGGVMQLVVVTAIHFQEEVTEKEETEWKSSLYQ
ncbi:hypothetical protein VULLAG_LOCUS8307 [Vulpes lagopus]